MTDKTIQLERLDNVNEFLKLIGSTGRQFFNDRDSGCYAEFELDARGRVWFYDDYTQSRIYTHFSGRWRQFSHGGTLKNLVILLRDHIKKNKKISADYFSSNWHFGGLHPWGYDEVSLEKIRLKGLQLGIVAIEKTSGG
ncbi:MAG: hypothetical protein IBX55_00450 [Methyloprofundus sp.]|nr:hypothetical protein [Methyloprofundus sp.]